MTLTVVHRAVLEAAHPYEFALSVRLEGFAPMAGEHRAADGCVRRAFAHPDSAKAAAGAAVVADVTADDSGDVRLAVFAESALSPARPLPSSGPWPTGSAFVTICAAFTRSPSRSGDGAVDACGAGVAPGSFSLTGRGDGLLHAHPAQHAMVRRRPPTPHGGRPGPVAVVDDVVYRAFPSLDVVAGLSVRKAARLHGQRPTRDRVREVAAGVAQLGERGCARLLTATPAPPCWLSPAWGPSPRCVCCCGAGPPRRGSAGDAPVPPGRRQLYGTPPPTPDDLRARYGRQSAGGPT